MPLNEIQAPTNISNSANVIISSYDADSFTYRANDGIVASNLATVTIDVAPTNQPPTGVSILTDVGTTVPIGYTVSAPERVASLRIEDDFVGSHVVTLTGADAALFAVVEEDGEFFLHLLPAATTAFAIERTISVR